MPAPAAPYVESVNVGGLRTVRWRGRDVRTGIFKTPVDGPVEIGPLGLAGDQQADPRYHGGPRKAVYACPGEHLDGWRAELPAADVGPGAVGENLTLRGLLETDVRVGDRLRAGTALLVVTEPRTPCFKLGVRLGHGVAQRRMLLAGRTGFYCAVAEPGLVTAGDGVRVVASDAAAPTIAELVARLAAR